MQMQFSARTHPVIYVYKSGQDGILFAASSQTRMQMTNYFIPPSLGQVNPLNPFISFEFFSDGLDATLCRFATLFRR